MKNIVFYPILISINPILLMYAININNFASSLLFPIILIAPLLAFGSMWLLSKLIKDIHRAGYIVFLLTLWFYYYIPVRIFVGRFNIGSINFSSHWIIFTVWFLIIAILASNWLWRRITSPQTITLFLNVVCLMLFGLSIFRIAINIIPRYLAKPNIQEVIQSLPEPSNKTNLPDIYYIILDGYARQDVLQELYDYDNSKFVHALEERGFFVADQSQTNYIQTVMSLASSLNMEYISGPTSIIAQQMPIHGQLIEMINNSKTRALLTQMGYQFISFSTGYYPTEITNADIFYVPPEAETSQNLVALLMMNSILSPFIEMGVIDTPIIRFGSLQARVNYSFDMLASKVPFIDGPKMVFVHIVAPHPPFIFDQNGPITPDEPLNMLRSSDFSNRIDHYKQMYISDLMYLNKRTMQAIDGILMNSNNSPIIIIQSDHGPDIYMDWSTGTSKCMKERFSILNAYHLPNGGSSLLKKDISPVNTFALIFNYYLGTHFELLPNQYYFATWVNSFPYADVSDISQSCNLP